MTIVDWNNSRGIHPIWDCGKKKWVYPLKQKPMCQDKLILGMMHNIRNKLSFDLIQPKRRGPTPIHGACYIASEALYHLLNQQYTLTVKRYKIDGINHWWLETENEIIDPTAEQFDFECPYHFGKAASFLTRQPSHRTQELLVRLADIKV